MIPIPLDDIVESAIDFGGVIQSSVIDGKIVIENVDETEDFVCDEDNPCDGDCESPFLSRIVMRIARTVPAAARNAANACATR